MTTVLRRFTVAASCATLLAATAVAQVRTLAPGFKERAIVHVRQLAAFPDRVAGGAGEAKAAAYIKEQMAKAGLEVVAEPFEFRSFALESAVLTAGTDKADILRLGFNPYADSGRLIGEFAFVESADSVGDVLKMELDDKIVVTTARGNLSTLAIKKPRAIVSLSLPDFQRFQAAHAASGEIALRGKVVNIRSANIVGTLASESGGAVREIILSAHYDSWKGPGANDNASGVAVLLELARHFRSRKPAPAMPMRFVAFGAEEFGMLGAKAYLEKHQIELQNCQLLFNMDTVGGGNTVFAETRGGVRNIPAKVESQLPKDLNDKATGDLDGRWVLLNPGLGPLFDSANVPEWLRTAVSETGKELGLEIRSSSNMGSDHRVFIQAGVVATNIAASGTGMHTPADVAESVKPDSLETAAQVVSAVVEKAMRSAAEGTPR